MRKRQTDRKIDRDRERKRQKETDTERHTPTPEKTTRPTIPYSLTSSLRLS